MDTRRARGTYHPLARETGGRGKDSDAPGVPFPFSTSVGARLFVERVVREVGRTQISYAQLPSAGAEAWCVRETAETDYAAENGPKTGRQDTIKSRFSGMPPYSLTNPWGAHADLPPAE